MSYKLKYPVAFHPVDMAIMRTEGGKKQVLLAQKVKDSVEGKNVWRFPGGFLDPWDSCAEEAAVREAIEETGMDFFIESREYFKEYFAKKAPLTKKLSELIEDKKYSSEKQDYVGNENEITQIIKELHSIKIDPAKLAALRSITHYIGSTQINDVRYENTDHTVITTFYELTPTGGEAGEGPFDDIARTKWFYLSEITEEIMHPSHKVLFEMLFSKYKLNMEAGKIIDKVNSGISEVDAALEKLKNSAVEIFDDVAKNLNDIFKDKK